MLRAGATSHSTHILARISRGDLVEPQQGAVSLPEDREGSHQGFWRRGKFPSEAVLQETLELGRPPPMGLKELPALNL